VPDLFRRIIDTYAGLGMVSRVAVVVAIALVTTAAGFAAIVFLPEDHFLPRPIPDSWWRRHWMMRWFLLGLKNAAGGVIAMLGIVMLVAPGPGLVFILLGLSLLDFPGKRKLERKLVERPSVIRFLNDLRGTFKRPPFLLEE
jgi:hypothetical protein